MAVVIGLGNPGERYDGTRHNVGFRVVNRLVARWRARPSGTTPTFWSWGAEVEGRAIHLLMPRTYMNRSGEALEAWREARGLAAEELLVVADDVYLPVGMIRLRAEGSSGGHLGLESIERALPGRGFARLRVGVGTAGDGEALKEHVLERFEETEEQLVEQTIEQAADAVEVWALEGTIAAMNRFNRKVAREVHEE